MRLAFVTGNPGKFREAQHALQGIATLEQDAGGYAEIQADTLDEVARNGLEEVAKRRDPPFFLEDAGLFVDALGGFPGVYSAYAYRTIGWPGILRLLSDQPNRAARFVAVVAYRDPAGWDHLFRGEAVGRIVAEGQGSGGFGFDPIFAPDAGDGRTFAQVTPAEKDRLSHRGAALRAFVHHLRPREKDS